MPGLHTVGSTVPVEQNEPAGHVRQSSALVMDRLSAAIMAFWKRPDGQGSAADAPSAQYEAGEQATHAVWPLCTWKRPAGQREHRAAPEAATVPGLHSTGAMEPTAHALPAGQTLAPHCASELSPMAALKVPSGHGVAKGLLPAQ